MRKQYTVIALLLVMAVVLTGCSWNDLKAKFVGSEENVSDAAVTVSSVDIEDYNPAECVALGEYKGVEVDCTLTEEEKQQEIDNMLLQFSSVEQIKKGKCKDGQSVNIDYTGKVDGKEVDGQTASDEMIQLGSSNHIDGFDKGIVGMKPGKKKELKLTFPTDYEDSTLAGKEIIYNITLNYIAGESKTPELTDEFVKENTKFGSVKEFKEEMDKVLREQKKSNAALTALQTIVDNSTVNKMPETLKEAHKQQADHSYRYSMQQYYGDVDFETLLGSTGMTKDVYEQQLDQAAENNAKTQLVFEAIAEKENIVCTEADIQNYVAMVASGSASQEDNTIEDFQKQYEKVYGKAINFDDFLKTSCLYEKVMNFINDSLKIKE